MNKKTYQEPNIDVVTWLASDVLTVSGENEENAEVSNSGGGGGLGG